MTLIATASVLVSLFALAPPTREAVSPALLKIAQARLAIAEHPDRYQPYNELALALARRARETADDRLYLKADETLAQSFQLKPDNLEGRKVEAWVMLGRHEFARALELATTLNRRSPDDVLIYGYLVDANIELGNYGDAEQAAQWMLDLRPGNVPGTTRAAYLRELFGDVDGAIDLMNAAYQRTPPTEVEDRAWILSQLAHLHLAVGQVQDAESLLQQALGLFPAYHYAMGNLAKVRLAQDRPEDAVGLLRQRYQAAPSPEHAYELAEALEKAGQRKQAKVAYLEFEKKAREEMQRADNANHELVFYYADHARKPAEALRIARREIARRRDSQTLHSYAWALYVNHRYAEARMQMERALKVGLRDATFFYHAGVIAMTTRDWTGAANYLRRSLETSRVSEVTGDAQRALDRVTPHIKIAVRK